MPEGVRPPSIVGVGSREITVAWNPPRTPNGLITMYNLYANGDVVFSGLGNITVVSSLIPFREYIFVLEACTAVGCFNSTTMRSQTLHDAPSGLAPPTLTVLGPSSILARWEPPTMTNGMIIRYELRIILGESNFEVVFNDVDLDLEATVTGLHPDTLYTFQLLAFNTGGSVSSLTTQVLTLEDIPDDLAPPTVDEVGPAFLLVSWSPPGVPNGDIVLYNLTLDGEVVFSTTEDERSYRITGLRPFTQYSLAVVACTVRGCGSSNDSVTTTLEDVPTGYVPPMTLAVSPVSITLDISPVLEENGLVIYLLTVSGDFSSESTGELVTEQRTVYNRSEPGRVLVTRLVAFTNYTFQLEVSNTAGTLIGPSFLVTTSPSRE